MVQQEEIQRLPIGTSLLVWFVAAVLGWAALVGVGYSVYRVGDGIVAAWTEPDGNAPAVSTAGPTEQEMRELRTVAPAAGGHNGK